MQDALKQEGFDTVVAANRVGVEFLDRAGIYLEHPDLNYLYNKVGMLDFLSIPQDAIPKKDIQVISELHTVVARKP